LVRFSGGALSRREDGMTQSDWMKSDWMKRFARLAAAGLIGLAMAGTAAPGARAADDEDDVAPDTKFLQNILHGLGLRRPGEGGIDYRERSPLVIPPARNLPPPESGSITDKTAAWPNDPDVKRAKEIRAQRKLPTRTVEDEWNPELPSQLGPRARGPVPGQQPSPGPYVDPTAPSTQAELKTKSIFSSFGLGMFGVTKEEYATFTSEPPRTSLIEPPAGYRTPSASQPYGVGKDTAGPGALNPLDHATSNNSLSR
jgi:hypothetical protein